MRRTGALAAAALLALALFAPGCDLVSSLTPFGVGHQDYGNGGGAGGENLNGLWSGSTGGGGPITFTVASGKVSNIKFLHVGECLQSFELTAREVQIADDMFVYENRFESQGRILVEGHFTSPENCSGTYFYEGLATGGGCPTAATGTFTAERLP
jgi:hypothetical protein